MEMETILTAISTVGFPIAIAVWFMLVGHKDSQNTAKAVNDLSKAVENNTRTFELLHGREINAIQELTTVIKNGNGHK
jgi:hypothetical protein